MSAPSVAPMPPYAQQTLRQIIGEIVWYMILMTIGLFVWNLFTPEQWRDYWDFQTGSYRDFWDVWGDEISFEAAPYMPIVWLLLGLVMAMMLIKWSTWAAKLVIAWTLTLGLLSAYMSGSMPFAELFGVAPPGWRLIAAAVLCAVWLGIAKVLVSARWFSAIRDWVYMRFS